MNSPLLFRKSFVNLFLVMGCFLTACIPLALSPQSPIVNTLETPIIGETATPYGGDIFTDLPPEKQTAEVSLLMTRQALIDTITPELPTPGVPPTLTPAPIVTGIFPDSTGPRIPDFFAINHWQNIVNGERVLVYAGARVDMALATPITNKGLLLVIVDAIDYSNRSIVEYETEGELGPLMITVADGYRLTITNENGVMLYFDVPTRQFVDSLTATVTAPTVTPLPLATPTVQPLPSGYPQFTVSPQTQSPANP